MNGSTFVMTLFCRMCCSHLVKLTVVPSCVGPKAPAGPLFMSVSELKVPDGTNWNGLAGVSSSDSSMSDAVLQLPSRVFGEVA